MNRTKRLFEFLAAPQENLPLVIRWSTYQEEGCEPKGRLQNTLQHSFTITLLAMMVIHMLRPTYPLKDELLLGTAFAVHDMGEGILGRDTLYPDKTAAGDAEEYVAFAKSLQGLDASTRNFLTRAFLLQFALKSPAHWDAFPIDARIMLAELKQTYAAEALLFEALEHIDYMLYGLEQRIERQVPNIMEDLVEKQLPLIRDYAERIPGLDVHLWTPEDSAWCLELLVQEAA